MKATFENKSTKINEVCHPSDKKEGHLGRLVDYGDSLSASFHMQDSNCFRLVTEWGIILATKPAETYMYF